MTNTMRTLGMLVRAVWPDGDAPEAILSMALVKPASAVAMIAKKTVDLHDDDPRQAETLELMDRLPGDLIDPPRGVSTEDQGPFWLGYYHYAGALTHARTLGPAALEKIGQALYGPRWQTDISKDLDLSDARRVRQWMSGERPIPPGVWADLGALAARRQMLLAEIVRDFQERDEA